jgi:subtilase family serine protease
MLSAVAAFQPAIVVAGPVAAPGNKPAVGVTPATQASAPYTPAQVTTAYGVNLISFGAITGNGAGQTIAIVDAFNDPDIVSDTASFNTQFNLPQFNVAGGPTFSVLNQTGGTTPPTINGQGWDLEESLDVQWAHSIAPQANIILYESNTNNDDDMDAAVATAAANPAVSVVSMSWGEGEFQGEQTEDPFVLTPTTRTGGVTFLAAAGDGGSPAIYPATSPDVVSVGGTSLFIQTDGTYTSESVWNNNNGNATGGGVSSLESQPAYQVGNVNGASTTNRAVPDVSMDADPDTGVYVLDSYSGGWFQVGGTSLSTPLWAGLVAIANQGRALNGETSLNGLTQTLPTLYNLPSSDFNDITVGNNGTYSATPGYDLVTGRGTPIANLLVPDLANSNINWSPTVSGPTAASTNQNTPLTLSGSNAITLTDQIAGTNTDSLTLSVNDGTLTLGSTSNLTFTSGANGSASMTVSGAIGDLESAVSGLTYTPNTNYSGPDSLSVLLADPAANVSASASVALTINAPSVPPSITAPATGSLNENGSLIFSTGNGNAVSVTDSGAGSNPDSLTLSVAHGTLALASTSGLTFTSGANGTGSFTVSGTVTDLDNALNGLTYQPIAAYIGPDSLSISVLDPGDSLSAATSVALTVNIAPPAISAPASASLTENSSLVFSSANSDAISFTDINASPTSKTESLTLSVAHGTLTLGSTSGLTFTAGKNNSASLTATGTVANLNKALAGLTYKPTAAYFGSDSLAISVADPGDGQSASTNVALSVNALSPPTITAPATGSLGENLSLTFSAANSNAISVADANAGTKADTLTLSVTNGTLTLGATPGLTFKSGKNGTASFTISATLANLNTALNGLTYKPTTGYSGADSLSISISDPGDGQSASTAVALTVNAATAPVISAPGTASLNENSTQVFSAANSNAISFTDANAGTAKTESLTLSVSHGTLKLGTTFGLTVVSGANNSATMTVTGTVTNLNAALNGLTYKPTTGYSGGDSLSVSVSDPGDTLSASLNVALTVNVLSPTIKAPATASVAENASLVFSTTNNTLITATDVNAGSGIEQVTLTATNGTLKLGSTTGITFISGANKTASMTISGTLTNLNNALKNLTFTPTVGYTGSASVGVTYSDAGNGLSASANVAITVGNTATTAGSTPVQLKTSGPVTSPSNSVSTASTDDSSTDDSQNHWKGFSAALATLNS